MELPLNRVARYTRYHVSKTSAGNSCAMSRLRAGRYLLRSFCAVLLAASLTAASSDRFPDERDCVAVFDFFVAIASPACVTAAPHYEQPDKIAAAISFLEARCFLLGQLRPGLATLT